MARTQARRRYLQSTRQLRYQLHSVQGRAKCPTDAASVPQRRELVTTRAARQGHKSSISNDGSVVGLPNSEPAPQRMEHFLRCTQISACHSPFSTQTSQFPVVFLSRSSKPHLFQFYQEIHSSASPFSRYRFLSTLYHHN